MNHLWRLVIFSLLQPLHSLAPKVRSYGFARALATCRVQSPQLIWVCKATTSLKTSKVQLFANTKGVSSNWNEARYLVSQGMESFRRGRVTESVDLFDQADSLVPDGSLHPYLWQRGISLYYVNRLQDASDQFRSDVKVNPNDVEEIVWDIAAQLRLRPSDFPVSTQMTLPPGARERNKVMTAVYKLFRGEGTERDLALAGHESRSSGEEFYSLFYLGLYCEARGEDSKAAEYMKKAIQTEYATSIGRGDYMTSVAKVHCALRHWA